MSLNLDKFKGGAEALKWNRKDLPNLDASFAHVPGRTCAVQAGANLGVWPARLAQKFATVYTFEPASDLFVIMTANAPAPNILRYQAALGYHRGLVGVSRVRRDDKPNAHEGITHVSGDGVIPTLRLDDFALPVVDLISLDVEGFETYALMGAEATIARCRPVLVVEVNKNLAYMGLTEEDLRSQIAAYDYVQVDRLGKDDVWIPAERAS